MWSSVAVCQHWRSCSGQLQPRNTSVIRRLIIREEGWRNRRVKLGFFFLIFLIEVKFTYHIINHVRVNVSVAFSTFVMLHNCHLYLASKHFHSRIKPSTHEALIPHSVPSPLTLGIHQSAFYFYGFVLF